MRRLVRFIHAADLHLGSPLRVVASESPRLKTRLDEAGYRAVERLVEAALRYEVDFVVLSGDIYDQESRSVRANQFLSEQLSRLSSNDIPTFMVYGNHDPLVSERVGLPEQVVVFGSDEVESALVCANGEPVARVMGQSYRLANESRRMHLGFDPPDEDVLNVGMLHTGLDPDSRRYVPCSLGELAENGRIHYWALGHVHRLSVLRQKTPCVAYPGVLQGRHVREPGPGGCLLVEAAPAVAPRVRFVPTSELIWRTEHVHLDRLNPSPANLAQLREVLRQRASEILDADSEHMLKDQPVDIATAKYSPGYVVRWVIRGRGRLHSVISDGGLQESEEAVARWLREDFSRGEPFLWTESVQFRTAAPLPEFDDLAQKDPLVAELLDITQQVSEDEKMRRRIRSACGEVWEDPHELEEEAAEYLALTEETLDQLIDAARDLVLDRILRERTDYVD